MQEGKLKQNINYNSSAKEERLRMLNMLGLNPGIMEIVEKTHLRIAWKYKLVLNKQFCKIRIDL